MSIEPDVAILIADDDSGHVRLIEKNLRRAALANRIERFEDGQQVLDFLFRRGDRKREPEKPYLLLLDIRMPKVDGVEVLRQIKNDAQLRPIPVIMLTTTDDPREIERCYVLGCSDYVVKPVNCEEFAEAINKIGRFIKGIRNPEVNHIN